MLKEILPKIHTSGNFSLKQPYNNLLINDLIYTCIAIRELQELRLKGIDAYSLYYQPYGLSKDVFEQDYSDNVSIITLKSSSGDIKLFPSSYLASFPSGVGYPYAVMSIAIKLGALPINKDLSFLQKKLKDLVKDEIGVDEEPKLMQLSQVEIVSEENHKTYEDARAVLTSNSTTDRAKVISLTQENEKLKVMVNELEQYIINVVNNKNDVVNKS